MSTSREVNRKVSEMSKEPTERFIPHTPAWQRAEALRLRMESARYERLDFAQKATTLHGSSDVETHDNPDAQLGPSDIAERDFLNPTFDDQLNRAGSSQDGIPIMEEIAEMERTGKLRPFVEGEPIGKRQKWVCKPAPPLYTRNQMMEWRRAEMLALRAKNDRDLVYLLEGK